MKRLIHKHYHWVIAVVALLHLGIFVGFLNTAGIFVLPITQSMVISRSSFSIASSFLFYLSASLAQIGASFVYRRFGYRKMICVGLLLVIISLLVIAFSKNYTVLCLGYTFLGIAFGVCGSTSTNWLIYEWFHRNRGLIWGLLTSVTGLGGSIWCLILQPIIQESGWRYAYIVAAASICVVLLANMLFTYNKPADMGLLPYGDGECVVKKIAPIYSRGCSFAELVRKPVFYLTVLVLFAIFLCIYTPYTALVPHLIGNGFADAEAAQLQSILLLALATGKVVVGWLMDRVGVRKVTALCCLGSVAAMLLLLVVSDYTQAFAAVVLYGFSLPITTVIVPTLTMDLFGYNSYVTAAGILCAMVSAGNMVAGPIGNGVFDSTGSYTAAIWAAAIVMVLMVAVFGVICRQADKLKRQFEKETTFTHG